MGIIVQRRRRNTRHHLLQATVSVAALFPPINEDLTLLLYILKQDIVTYECCFGHPAIRETIVDADQAQPLGLTSAISL